MVWDFFRRKRSRKPFAQKNSRWHAKLQLESLEDRVVPNNTPVGQPDFNTLNENTPLTLVNGSVLDNDIDADGDTLQAVLYQDVSQGTLSLHPDGTFTYTPPQDFNGIVTFAYLAYDQTSTDPDAYSDPITVTLTVNPVNQAPSFIPGADQTVNENAGAQVVPNWATNLSAGPSNESSQALSFLVSNSNNALFSAQPSIDATGQLTYTPAADANGSATVTVSLQDDGGTANGGVDTSAPQNFTLTVNPVNQAPSFTPGPDQTVNENAGVQTVASWATNISVGPANESSQTPTFLVSTDNDALFSAVPSIDANGTLTYTPAADANGAATVTVSLQDDGGTANGGVDTSAPQTFTLTVNPVNQAPSYTAGPDQTVNENAGAQTVDSWATSISVGPANESSQTPTFLVTTDKDALFSAVPSIDANGTLTYTPVTDANGAATVTVSLKDDGGTANGGVDTSAPQNFTITVNPVNQAPSFTAGPDQTVNEDTGAQTVTGWATNISVGPANESSQTPTFLVTTDNDALFSAGPSIDANGTLTYTPATDANGMATVTVFVKDDGGTANGGVDTSTSQTFTITVNPVNQAPSFTAGADQTVNEDAGPQTVSGWATNLSAGPANESSQTLTFFVSNDNNGLFSAQPSLDATGNLTYTPAPDASGSATVSVYVQDDGGTANGGVDTSPTVSFTVTVNFVNDAPSFTKGADQTVNENAGAQTVTSWATNISVGPPNESSQTLTFVVSNDNNGLFSAQPSIDATGTLTYTPAQNTTGTATVTVYVQDNGGTANGGVDTSDTQTFHITVNSGNSGGSGNGGAPGNGANPSTTLTVTVSATPDLVDPGQPVQFQAQASGGTGSGYTYSWDFGDGSSDSGASPTHAFSESDTWGDEYAATVTVTDDGGNTGVEVAVVAVLGNPPINDTSVDVSRDPSVAQAAQTDQQTEDAAIAQADQQEQQNLVPLEQNLPPPPPDPNANLDQTLAADDATEVAALLAASNQYAQAPVDDANQFNSAVQAAFDAYNAAADQANQDYNTSVDTANSTYSSDVASAGQNYLTIATNADNTYQQQIPTNDQALTDQIAALQQTLDSQTATDEQSYTDQVASGQDQLQQVLQTADQAYAGAVQQETAWGNPGRCHRRQRGRPGAEPGGRGRAGYFHPGPGHL